MGTETDMIVRDFGWMCAHGSIGVKACLVRRGMVEEESCRICQRASETILHALRDCHKVKEIWSLNPNLSYEIVNQAVEFLCYVASPRNPARVVSRSIRWEKPAMGWKKLNTDGSVLGSCGQAGCGGVVRDDQGNWIAGFSRHIGTTNCFVAELWGLRDGLSLCLFLNIPCLVVEVDAKAVVDVLRNYNYDNIVISPIMDDCRQLVSCFQQIQIKHCYRQANRCANYLSPPVDVLQTLSHKTIIQLITKIS
ncbi:hypothetical protein SO802_019822 [Lithocarpus litseifolius]|uniref:RNase H type-1 domain-containing protein n=1 Tax=Lithocarpus litseifolius TaxID=425828 RepID=A0AAW2CTV6_9ROSI